MKLLATILALTVLILSCLPCMDADECLRVVKTEVSTVSKTTPQKDKHETKDSCSPFCSCSCCASISFAYYQIVLPVKFNNYHRPIYTVYPPSDIIEISLPVWQPPQLV